MNRRKIWEYINALIWRNLLLSQIVPFCRILKSPKMTTHGPDYFSANIRP